MYGSKYEVMFHYLLMFSIYQTTGQGERTRARLLAILGKQDGLTRQDLVAAGLTYDQVRRQTENLILERAISSRKDETGRRRYYLR